MDKVKNIKVWDIVVRLFHWLLVLLFIVSYLTGEEQDALPIPIHVYSGYAIIGLLLIRIIWGVIGGQHARFRDFIYSPSTVLAYLRALKQGNPKRYLGHNPAGGYMIIAMLVMLTGTTMSGLKCYAEEGYGPLAESNTVTFISAAYADDDDDDEEHSDGEEFWEEVHEFFVTMTLLLVFLHIMGVILSSKRHKENLVRAMITGKKVIDNKKDFD